jgi:hypothetical protein
MRPTRPAHLRQLGERVGAAKPGQDAHTLWLTIGTEREGASLRTYQGLSPHEAFAVLFREANDVEDWG